MGVFVKGDVVVVPFPFSDLSGSKKRPAVVISNLMGDDLILCQITSKQNSDPFAISISSSDFITGSIRDPSLIRPNKLFTFDTELILSRLGHLCPEKMSEITTTMIRIFQQ